MAVEMAEPAIVGRGIPTRRRWTAPSPSFFVGLPLQILNELLYCGEPSPERARSDRPTASLKRALVMYDLIRQNMPHIRWSRIVLRDDVDSATLRET